VVSRRRTWNSSLKLSPDYDYWLRLGLQVPENTGGAAKSASTRSQTADEGKSEEYVRLISDYYKTQPVPRACWQRRTRP